MSKKKETKSSKIKNETKASKVKEEIKTPEIKEETKVESKENSTYYESFEEFVEELSDKANEDALQGLFYLFSLDKRIKELKTLFANNIESCYELHYYESLLNKYQVCLELIHDPKIVELCNSELKENELLKKFYLKDLQSKEGDILNEI